MKKFTMGGAVIGMSIGSYVPLLWGAGFFSFSSIVLSGIFGILGIWIGYHLGRGY